ncbi:hypothetical protein HYH03_010330 [Edaphochlamys debaryana]|uniref:Uncharacterized protein n=1 Tax=Edaphochlamys debaryana TaxID=47281 RepID=A0A835XWV1_9CHLO|nr:hypothetical protein HYH03_010330 [Edaphochlamys debaryana]|eukprot:KAG2491325.1 hypothetical protein HYH03_010330 [Edaphochlamys debaryana]
MLRRFGSSLWVRKLWAQGPQLGEASTSGAASQLLAPLRRLATKSPREPTDPEPEAASSASEDDGPDADLSSAEDADVPAPVGGDEGTSDLLAVLPDLDGDINKAVDFAMKRIDLNANLRTETFEANNIGMVAAMEREQELALGMMLAARRLAAEAGREGQAFEGLLIDEALRRAEQQLAQ